MPTEPSDVIRKLATTQNPQLLPVDTVAGHFQHQLHSMGLFTDQVLAIWATVVVDPTNEPMNNRWNDFRAGYPESVMRVCWLSVRHATAEWLAANKPMHWARSLFS